MHIVSWNVNGLPTTLKEASYHHQSLEKYFSDVLKADIVCFQEAKVREDKLEKWLACVPGYESFWAFSQNKKGYSGVVTYVKEAFSPVEAAADCLPGGGGGGEDDITQEGRVMLTDHGSFVLLNVYAPNAGEKPLKPRLEFKMRFLNALRSKCDELVASGRHVIVVGDLNVSHREADIHSCFGLHKVYAPEELAWTDSFLSEYIDAWRHFHPEASDGFTCWNQKKSARLFNEGARIDFTVCDRAFQAQLVAADILDTPDKWSDHTAISLTLKDQPPPPAHPPAALSSRRMKQFQEDRGQSKLTALFSRRKAGGGRGNGDSPGKGDEPSERPVEDERGLAQEDRKRDQGGVEGGSRRAEKGGGQEGIGAELRAAQQGEGLTQEGTLERVLRKAGADVASREKASSKGVSKPVPAQGVSLHHANVANGPANVAPLGNDVSIVKEVKTAIATDDERPPVLRVSVSGESPAKGDKVGEAGAEAEGASGGDGESQGQIRSPTSKLFQSVGTRGAPSKPSMSGKKRGRNGAGKSEGSDTRTQLKLSTFFAKKQG